MSKHVHPIPHHKKPEYRRRFGEEIKHYYRKSELRGGMRKFSKRTGIPYPLLSDLVAGRETHNAATIERLIRIAAALSCELVLRHAEEETYDKGSTTFEELLRMGTCPTLEPIP